MEGGTFFPGDWGRKAYIIKAINWVFEVVCLPLSNIIYFMDLTRMHKIGQISFSSVCLFSPPVPCVDTEPRWKWEDCWLVYLEKVVVKDSVHWTLRIGCPWANKNYKEAMRYLGKSMVFGVGQIWVRILAQLHSLCSLDFTLVPVFPAFTLCGPPTTNFSLHWVLFICIWTCANIVSKQTNLALCLLHLLQLPPRLLLPLLPSFSEESPTLPVSSSAIPTHSSVPDDLASAPTVPLTCFCHSHNDSCGQPQRPFLAFWSSGYSAAFPTVELLPSWSKFSFLASISSPSPGSSSYLSGLSFLVCLLDPSLQPDTEHRGPQSSVLGSPPFPFPSLLFTGYTVSLVSRL